MSKLKVNSKVLSRSALLTHQLELETEANSAVSVYIEENGGKGATKDELIKIEAKWNDSKDGKNYNAAVNEVSSELEKRSKLSESAAKAVNKIKVSLDSSESTYNRDRYVLAGKELDSTISELVEEEDSLLSAIELYEKAKTDPKYSSEEIANLASELEETRSYVTELKGTLIEKESLVSKDRDLLDAHYVIVDSIGDEDLETNETIAEYVDVYSKAVTEQKSDTDFTGDAAECAQIVYGSKSTDKEMMKAIRTRAIDGYDNMVFEATLWTWNDLTLRSLIKKGFILSMQSTNIQYDKLGNAIGSLPVSIREPLKNSNSDLIVSWSIAQEKSEAREPGPILKG